jgi:propionyl-CoA carboxylase alpha chain
MRLQPVPPTSAAAPRVLQVHAGQELCVVEAMKMQNVLTAPRDGVVKELLASAGSTLSADQAILSFEEATKAARA